MKRTATATIPLPKRRALEAAPPRPASPADSDSGSDVSPPPLPAIRRAPARAPPSPASDSDTASTYSSVSARLAAADAVYDAARGTHASDAQRAALRAYCTAASHIKRVRESYTERMSALREVSAAARAALTAWMRREELTVVALPPVVGRGLGAALAAAEAEDADALTHSLPTFVRLVSKKNASITDARVLEAADAVGVNDMLDCLEQAPHLRTPLEAFIAATLRGVHERIRSLEYATVLTSELPRGGPKASEVVELVIPSPTYTCDLAAGERIALAIRNVLPKTGPRAAAGAAAAAPPPPPPPPLPHLDTDVNVAHLVCAIHVADARLAALSARIKEECVDAAATLERAEEDVRALVEAQREAALAAASTPASLRGGGRGRSVGGGDGDDDDSESEESGSEGDDTPAHRRRPLPSVASGSTRVTAAMLRTPTLEVGMGAQDGSFCRLRLVTPRPYMSFKRLVGVLQVAGAEALGMLADVDPATLHKPFVTVRGGRVCAPAQPKTGAGAGSRTLPQGSVLTSSSRPEFMSAAAAPAARGGKTRGKAQALPPPPPPPAASIPLDALASLDKAAILNQLRVLLATCTQGVPPDDNDRASEMLSVLEGGQQDGDDGSDGEEEEGRANAAAPTLSGHPLLRTAPRKPRLTFALITPAAAREAGAA